MKVNKNECEFIPRSRECTSITKQQTQHCQAIDQALPSNRSIHSFHFVQLFCPSIHSFSKIRSFIQSISSIHSVTSISPIHLVHFIHSFSPFRPFIHSKTSKIFNSVENVTYKHDKHKASIRISSSARDQKSLQCSFFGNSLESWQKIRICASKKDYFLEFIPSIIKCNKAKKEIRLY